MSELNRQDEPKKGKGELFVKRLDTAERIEVCVLCNKPEGFQTHWQPSNGRRKGFSLPCTKPIEECIGHKSRLPQRWRGYLHCFELHRGTPLFLEITPETLTNMKALIGESTIWRGLCVRFQRMNGKQTRVAVELLMEWGRRSGAPLAEPLSVEPMLRRLWQISQENQGREGGSDA
jgi:hypothetical protein